MSDTNAPGPLTTNLAAGSVSAARAAALTHARRAVELLEGIEAGEPLKFATDDDPSIVLSRAAAALGEAEAIAFARERHAR
ncbi:MAG: hypothetical protein JJT89_00485 [Nitriliruptoraceae bacterium]|nr:hypothetical protein [Nitriliruptoraceae bacterium]